MVSYKSTSIVLLIVILFTCCDHENLDMYKLTYSIDMSMDLFKIDLNVIQLEKEREWLVDLDLPLGTCMKIVSLIT